MSQRCAGMVLTIAIVLIAQACAIAAVQHVDPNDPGAYATVQEAIDGARHFDTIMVHPGVYAESIDFHGRAVTVTSLDPNDPGIVASTVIDGNGTTVVTFRHGETAFSKVLGLTLRNGEDGIYCSTYDCKPEIRNCVISDNFDDGIVGGLPTLSGCTIRDNGGDGIDSSSESIQNCTITGNSVNGIRNHYGDLTDSVVSGNKSYGVSCMQTPYATIVRCTISNNGGYGLHFFDSGPDITVVNATISGNGRDGISSNSSPLAVTNCTLVGNGENGILADEDDEMTVSNCIIAWNAEVGLKTMLRAVITSRYNNLYGNIDDNYERVDPGQNDLQEYPWFAGDGFWRADETWQEGDYHLLSTAGRFDPSMQAWVKDPIDSPCLDKGDPDMPFGNEPYPHGGRLNLGVYGGTAEASMHEGAKPVCIAYPEMDFNKDCKVDQADLDIFMEHMGQCNLDPAEACGN